jgi:4-amino-4-deoxy-L-arabinose transferase-like glycosyltransferase
LKILSAYFLKFDRTIFILFLILLLALSFRVGRCLTVPYMDKDSVLYLSMANSILEDGPSSAFERNPRIPPLYIFAVAGCSKYLGLSMETAGRTVSTVAGTFLVLAVFLMAKLVFKNDTYALIAAFLTATHPFLIITSEDIMRDSLFICLTAFSLVFAMYGAEKKNYWYWFISGFFCAAATMTRSEGIGILFALPLWFIVELIFNRKNILSYKSFAMRHFCCFLILIVTFASFSFPVEYALSGTSSKWKVFDDRAMGYIRSFLCIQKNNHKKMDL